MLASLLTFLDVVDTDGKDPLFEKVVTALGVAYPQKPLYDHFMDAIYGDDLPCAEEVARDMQVQGLIDLGDSESQFPDSPVAEYIDWDKYAAVEILLRYGATLNYEDGRGGTAFSALIDAFYKRSENDMLKYLELFSLYHINWELRSFNRWTSLHLACVRGLFEVVKYLVDHGADINAQDDVDNYETPLQQAIYFKQFAIALYLLDRGADPCVINRDGRHLLGGLGLHNANELRTFIEHQMAIAKT